MNKKIIVSILAIGLLLGSTPISMGEKETADESLSDAGELFYVEEESLDRDVSSPSELMPADPCPDSSLLPEYVLGEIIVKFKDDVDLSPSSSPDSMLVTGIESVDALNREFGVTSAEKLLDGDSVPSLSNVYILKLPADNDILLIAEEYKLDPNVEYAEPNYIYHPSMMTRENQQSVSSYHTSSSSSFIPNDPDFDLQWGLHNTGQTGGTPDADIDAPEAWEVTNGSSDVVIAILDTGIDYMHPDLGHCIGGINEEDFFFEAAGSESYSTTLSSFSGCDKVALHFSEINLEPSMGTIGLTIFDTNKNPGLIGVFYDNITTDVWTSFSELGGTTIRIEVKVFGTGNWSFSIDKVRKANWIKLSEQCPDKYVDGYDFVNDDPDPVDDIGHGTHCAGIAAAITNNNIGVAGVAGKCKIMPIEVIGETIGGDNLFLDFLIASVATNIRITRGLVYAADHGADVISMSIGPFRCLGTTVKSALDYADSKGVVLVAAAGNYGTDTGIQAMLAMHDKVFTVAATDHNDTKTNFSNYATWIDAAAPGAFIYSTTPTYHYYLASISDMKQDYDYASGTSSACPHVAGVAGLVLSKAKEQGISLMPQEVRTILRSCTDSVISSRYIGTGRINASTALQKTAPVTAELDNSLDDKEVRRIIKIKGVASGQNFQDYTIEYSRGPYPKEDSWEQIEWSSSPQTGILARWDTRDVEDGIYTIRLKVTAGGFTYIDRTFVLIDNVASTFYVDDDNTEGPWYGTQEYPFQHIQDAINICGSRDTIYVYSGNYLEVGLLVVLKSVTIIGEDRDTTIIDLVTGTAVIGGNIHISNFQLKHFLFSGFFSSGNAISGNTIIAGNIVFRLGRLNTISNNILNDAMISLIGSDENNIHGNIIDGAEGGVLIRNGRFNIIYDNTISTSGFGIKIQNKRSLGNVIYHNNFVDNSQNAYDEGINLWYRLKLFGKSTGNYWSDYTGEDNDGDGIGDTPYDIPGGTNKDRYPLMKPYHSHNIPPNKPDKPSGPTSVYRFVPSFYSTSTDDSDGNFVYYKWDWGDGSFDTWYLVPRLDFFPTIRAHIWLKPGEYEVKVKAKDIWGDESDWSEPLTVTVKKWFDWDDDYDWGDNSCFLAGTKVTMADGSYKNIEDIELGDIVKSYDMNTGDLVDAEVTKLCHHTPEEMPDYYVVINDQIRVTPNHFFFINGEPIPAGELQVGDLLTSSSGSDVIVESVEQVFDQVPTYNFEVSTDGGLTSFSSYVISFMSKSSSPEIEELPASKPAYSSQQNSQISDSESEYIIQNNEINGMISEGSQSNQQSIQGNNNQQSQQNSPSK